QRGDQGCDEIGGGINPEWDAQQRNRDTERVPAKQDDERNQREDNEQPILWIRPEAIHRKAPKGPTRGAGMCFAARTEDPDADGGPDSTFAPPAEYFRAPPLRSALYTRGSFGRPCKARRSWPR